ncbi:hypothetical protein [Akkermansia glycaniphila]|uniref:Uncharacterized protein n=1 Tax=Akkermansia glycaniphila TaxID=1679444 RepID=A0A1C7PA02_9BACT|nr:hypothetical protein [Akkermansia glycaniphila]OCA02194.1 hypothetical protein AC781_11585 [Akkermansia glycaniphila]SEH99330.1 Hypothetical protein PYTT_2380 [Akkermansia glycaniphila]
MSDYLTDDMQYTQQRVQGSMTRRAEMTQGYLTSKRCRITLPAGVVSGDSIRVTRLMPRQVLIPHLCSLAVSGSVTNLTVKVGTDKEPTKFADSVNLASSKAFIAKDAGSLDEDADLVVTLTAAPTYTQGAVLDFWLIFSAL